MIKITHWSISEPVDIYDWLDSKAAVVTSPVSLNIHTNWAAVSSFYTGQARGSHPVYIYRFNTVDSISRRLLTGRDSHFKDETVVGYPMWCIMARAVMHAVIAN